MFTPHGSQPPSVYWRRRLIVLGAAVLLVVLLVLTVRAITDDGSTTPSAGGTGSSSSTPAPSTPRSSGTSASTPTAPSPTVTGTVAACKPADLTIAAASDAKAYKLGSEPRVELLVTNAGSAPCAQDLADSQVELRVYNGESRVWGSHDCEIQPGVDRRTLPVGQTVRITVTWSGRTSQPACAGTRTKVGAGTYTLYAALSGKTGKAAQFSIG